MRNILSKSQKILSLIEIRVFQIFILGALLSAGVFTFDFSIRFIQIFLTFFAGLTCQYFWIKKLNLKKNSFLSAFISCLGIVLLLRSSHLWIHPLSAVLAICSKFLIQKNRRHIFNPSAFGICFVLFLPGSWLSPGQWGSFFLMGAWVMALGSFVTRGVKRIDISWLFLFFYLGGLFLRNSWLEYEWAVFQHSALNGSLLVFAFFMISDPKSSPDHFLGKLFQAFFVAMMSLFIHYQLYKPNGFIYSLMLSSVFVPFLNKIFKAQAFEWRSL